jgi:hypothetical protein
MHFAQHWILSWFIAEGGRLDLRGRRIVTVAGLLPDADVIPYAAAATANWLVKGQAFSAAWRNAFEDVHLKVHHHYTHGVGFVAATAAGAFLLSQWAASSGAPPTPLSPTKGEGDRKARSGAGMASVKVALLAALACVLHVLGDVIASGPSWPVYPLWPFSDAAWGYPWSWTLADWPNIALLALLLLAARQYAKVRGRSPLEALSTRLDARLVAIIGGNA